MLLSIIELARSEAIARYQPVTLCGSDNGRECRVSWNKKILIYIKSKTLYIFPNKENHSNLHYRAFPFHHYGLTFLADGRLADNNATFWYCAGNAVQWAIFVSRMGNLRLAEVDKSGNIYDKNGKALVC